MSPQTPRRRRKGLIAGSATATVAVIAGAVVGGVWLANKDNESDAIVALTGKFAAAADSGDPATVIGYVCGTEADAIKKLMHVKAGAPSPEAAPKPGVGTTDVVVKGELASARLTKAGADKKTMYFRKEAGQWKVCMSAEHDFNAAQ